ncbi:hypothetical protein ABBQ32_009507 [Trebouxia sp. C0010 RCD-2024]
MLANCSQVSAVRPTVRAQVSQRSARSLRAPVRCSAQKDAKSFDTGKLAALAAAASLMLAQPSFAGKLDDMLPNSSPAVPKEKFERDLGEGRKLQVDPSTTKNNASRVSSGNRGSPSDSADAREEPDMKTVGGGLPGISKALPKSSNAAPLTNGPNR